MNALNVNKICEHIGIQQCCRFTNDSILQEYMNMLWPRYGIMFQKCIFAESVHFNNIYQTDIFWVMSSLEFILGMWVMLNAKSY